MNLVWSAGAITEGESIGGQSKTDAGTGRVVPLTRRVCAALTLWPSRFADAGPDCYVFPSHHVGFAGNRREANIWDVDLARSMGTYSYKRGFDTARRKAKVDDRLYDARHTFVTRFAENPVLSEETIRQLAGHVSPRMLAHYAWIRAQARSDAIATLERQCEAERADFGAESPQKSRAGKTGAPLLN